MKVARPNAQPLAGLAAAATPASLINGIGIIQSGAPPIGAAAPKARTIARILIRDA